LLDFLRYHAFAAKHSWEASARAFVDHVSHARSADSQDEPVQFAVKAPRLTA
jgi:hypothetical protein